jgi:hypothetical protein
MRVFWQPIAKLSQAETRLFASILTIAALLLAFGLLAEEVIEGETLPFDRKLLLALRQAGNPGVPIGPPWLPEAARDISALCSTIVLGTLFLAVVGYSLLTRRPAAAWLMVGAVSSGVALNSLLKFSFVPRPDLVVPAGLLGAHDMAATRGTSRAAGKVMTLLRNLTDAPRCKAQGCCAAERICRYDRAPGRWNAARCSCVGIREARNRGRSGVPARFRVGISG